MCLAFPLGGVQWQPLSREVLGELVGPAEQPHAGGFAGDLRPPVLGGDLGSVEHAVTGSETVDLLSMIRGASAGG